MGKHIPPPPGPGRPKGCPNKFTTLKAAFLDAFEATGGAGGLVEWVKKSERNRLFKGDASVGVAIAETDTK
jgi:hypothetical protein